MMRLLVWPPTLQCTGGMSGESREPVKPANIESGELTLPAHTSVDCHKRCFYKNCLINSNLLIWYVTQRSFIQYSTLNIISGMILWLVLTSHPNLILITPLCTLPMFQVLTSDHWALSHKWAGLQVRRDNMRSPGWQHPEKTSVTCEYKIIENWDSPDNFYWQFSFDGMRYKAICISDLASC